MLLKQLEYFCAVVRSGSFTHAAEEFDVSQSAISQQVKNLEAYMGVPLIVRSGRRFKVTNEGKLLYERAESIIASVDKAVFDVRCLARSAPTSLSIGYLNRYDGWEIPSALAAFTRRHPQVELAMQADSHDGLYEKLLAGSLDIIFNDRRRALSSDFENVHLATSYRYVEVSEASPAAWHEHVTAQDLGNQRCILVATSEQREVEAEYYRGILYFTGGFTFAGSLEEARMMVAGNKGFLPIEHREAEGRTGNVIRRIPLWDDTGQMHIDYYAFWLKDRTNSLIREFAKILADLF